MRKDKNTIKQLEEESRELLEEAINCGVKDKDAKKLAAKPKINEAKFHEYRPHGSRKPKEKQRERINKRESTFLLELDEEAQELENSQEDKFQSLIDSKGKLTLDELRRL